jgi:ABC-type lipoprotein export system ATPase subunit
MSDASALISAEGLRKTFDPRDGPVLDGASLALAPGDSVAVTGASGSGKTTLLSVLGGLLAPDAGHVRYRLPDGTKTDTLTPETRGGMLGIVFQSAHLIPTLTAAENVEMPLLGQGMARGARERRAAELLGRLGLAGLAHHRPSTLSGGQRQRVGVARAFALGPAVILADEPTGNLDSVASREVAEALFEMCAENGSALVVVTHDLALAARAARCLELREGRLVARDMAGAA